MPIPTVLAVAAASEPAGGAAIGQVILATSIAAVATAGLLWLVTTYRQRRGTPLERVADFSERVSGLPSCAAPPPGAAGRAPLLRPPRGRRGRRADHRAARDVLGHLAAHRQRPRSRAARQPRPLPDPRRSLR